MTEAHIKESISRHLVGLLAAKPGIVVSRPELDYGVDLHVDYLSPYELEGKTRYAFSGLCFQIQLKCTTSHSVQFRRGAAFFDLNVENYNDLIGRKALLKGNDGGHIPLILIVVVLPGNSQEWIEWNENFIKIWQRAFWYYPFGEDKMSANKRTKRITLSLDQQLDLDFFTNLPNLLD